MKGSILFIRMLVLLTILFVQVVTGCTGKMKGKGYAPLVGKWKVSQGSPEEKRDRVIGDTTWALGETIEFKNNGNVISGKTSTFKDNQLVEVDQVCTYRLVNDRQLQFDCGFGQSLTSFDLDENSLAIDFWNMEQKPPIKYVRVGTS